MRPNKDQYFISLAALVATRTTCAKQAVGCVLVNARGHVLATGYNGVVAGQAHCNDGHPCPGAGLPAGSGQGLCQAVHAEQNALLQCRDIWDIDTVYCTLEPCLTCTKLLLNTGARRIVFQHTGAKLDGAQGLWSAVRGTAMILAGPTTWKPLNAEALSAEQMRDKADIPTMWRYV